MTVKIHDFTERLEWSEQLGDEAAWVELYKRFWPDMLSCVSIDRDSKWQRWGVDRVIFLPEGLQRFVDEKKRATSWDDFLCEEWSDYKRKKPGWSVDPHKRCDYVAYAIPLLGKCYLLPFELLRITCVLNLPEWKTLSKPKYPLIAYNNGYETWNCAVKWDRLFKDMRQQMHRSFGAGELMLPMPRDEGGQLLFPWANKESKGKT